MILKREPIPGLLVLAISPLIWTLGRYLGLPDQPETRPLRLLLVTVIVTAVSLMAIVIAVISAGPGTIRDVVSFPG